MKKKYITKYLIFILIAVCFMAVCNRMPKMLPAVYHGIFSTISFPAFMFYVGIFVCEIVVLKRWIGEKRHYYGLVIVAFILSSIVLFHGNESLYDRLTPGSNTTLLTRSVANESVLHAVFYQYYFDDKNVEVSEELFARRDEFPYLFTYSVAPRDISIAESVNISEEMKKRILSHPYYERGEILLVIDPYWNTTNTIKVVQNDENYIFCSQELIDSIEDGTQDGAVLENEACDVEEASVILRDIVHARPYKREKQIVVMMLLFLAGLLITLPVWGEKYPALAVCLSIPVSAASVCLAGVVMMALHIPYHLYSIGAFCILGTGIRTFKNRKVYKRLDWSAMTNYILAALGIILFLGYMEICFTSQDSIVKCTMGYRLAKYGSVLDILDYVAPYGMLEPMIMSLGYMFHCDFLYSFYPLIVISGLGLMCAGHYYMNDKNDGALSLLVLLGGIVLLVSNYDFLLGSFYTLAHGPIAVYTLLFIMFIILRRQLNIQGFAYIVALSASMILLTRVEGAVYVLFLLAASMGMENDKLRLRTVGIVLPIIIILWNGYQILYIGQTNTTLFWTPDRGYMLIGISVIMILFTVCFHQPWKIWNNIRKHYYALLLIAIVGGTAFLSMFVERTMASVNMPIYLAHFTNSAENNANSAALWLFVFLLVPIVLLRGGTAGKYAVTVGFGYLMLIYVICLFRYEGDTQVPLRLGYGDSSRRTIVQIMPTIVWLISYSIGCAEDFVNKRVGSEKDER